MIWFAIGAALGMAIVGINLIRHPMDVNYPIQGFLFSAALGAAVIGLPLWLIFG